MDFSKVKVLMDTAVSEHCIPCSDIAVMYQGELVYRYMNGTSDDEKKKLLKGDEQYFLYSATKPITCVATLQLVEAGKLRLEDKVSDYIPEFGNMMVKTRKGIKLADHPIKIRHLLSMTSGLSYNLLGYANIKNAQKRYPEASTLEMVRIMAGDMLEFEPGEHFLYGVSHDVLGAIIEIVSGLKVGDYLKKYIFDVCGMSHTGFWSNEKAEKMVCSQYLYNPEQKKADLTEKRNGFILTSAYQSGGAGLISCVDDYSKFVAEMSNGNKLLKPATIDMMRSDQLNSQAYQDFQAYKPGYTYGLGVRTDAYGRYAHKGEFGWDGAAGSYVMIDPDNHIGVFYATHVRGHGNYLFHELHPAIRDAVYKAIIKE